MKQRPIIYENHMCYSRDICFIKKLHLVRSTRLSNKVVVAVVVVFVAAAAAAAADVAVAIVAQFHIQQFS